LVEIGSSTSKVEFRPLSIIRKTAFAITLAPALMLMPGMASAETLFGAMAKAYQNNPDLNAVRAALRATDENVTIAKAGMRPQIAASASATGVHVSNLSNGNPDFSYNTENIGLTITQQIFDGFQTLNNVRAAEAGVYASRESLKANEISILLAAAQAYADVARDQQIVVIRKQNLAFLQEQLNAANARLQVGEGTRTDVSQAEAQLAGSQALLAAAIAQLKQSEATYVQVVGDAPKGIKQPSPATKALPGSLDAAVATAIREHPYVLAALHAVDAAGYQVKSAEGTLLPGVVIQGNVGRNWTNEPSTFGTNPDNTVASVTAQLKIPIYQGGAEYGNIRKAKETLGEQRIKVDSARASVQQQVTSAYAQMEAAMSADLGCPQAAECRQSGASGRDRGTECRTEDHARCAECPTEGIGGQGEPGQLPAQFGGRQLFGSGGIGSADGSEPGSSGRRIPLRRSLRGREGQVDRPAYCRRPLIFHCCPNKAVHHAASAQRRDFFPRASILQ